MRLLVLPRNARKGPSSRLRHYQFLPHLVDAGFQVDVEPFLPDSYLDALYLNQRWPLTRTIAAFLDRMRVLVRLGSYDLVWIEKEVLPFLPALVERAMARTGVRFVADYDDVWQLRYRDHSSWLIRFFLRRKIETVMRRATVVTAGSPNLVECARQSGARHVVELPTVLDLDHYRLAEHKQKQPVRIVWIGSSLNSRYLVDIADALAGACQGGAAEVVAMGGRPLPLPGVPVRFEPWSEDREAEFLASGDIGIMPLPDNEWERGKCAFKILQYMAAGLPTVATPIGVNRSVVTPESGILATTSAEWVTALRRLIGDAGLRTQMGSAGRAKVERDYALASWGPRVATLLADVAKHGSVSK